MPCSATNPTAYKMSSREKVRMAIEIAEGLHQLQLASIITAISSRKTLFPADLWSGRMQN